MNAKDPIRYQDAGVSIDEADRAVGYIKKLAPATFNRNVLTSIGSFGGGFRLKGFEKPVLVSSIDGVGTKLKVAIMANRHDTVGEDLVNHCVNDIAVQGATPLFFLDYFAMGSLNAETVRDVVSGMAKACSQNKCALIGGETAEMPGLYAAGDYDLAGCIVGAVEKQKMLTGKRVKASDVLIGLPSTGLHTNGYSLARKLFFETAQYRHDQHIPELDMTAADALLQVHRSYLRPLQALHQAGLLKAAAHITGGGITDNLPRVLPDGVGAEIKVSAWPELPVFSLLRQIGNIPEDDYRRTFNTGIGMIFVIGAKDLAKTRKMLLKLREEHYEIGTLVKADSGSARVRYA